MNNSANRGQIHRYQKLGSSEAPTQSKSGSMEAPAAGTTASRRAWLVLNGLTLAVGNCGGPLVMRLYYHGGGGSIWFTAFLETGGWPFLFIPLAFAYARRRRESPSAGLYVMKGRVLGASAAIGLLTGLVDYLYAYGVKKLPLSTSAVLVASQLAFTAGFAYLLVRHRFTAYTVNAIVTILVGAVVLATHAGGDRPKGETDRDYFLGFFMTLLGAMLYGLVLPSIERTYQKARQAVTYTLVMEVQLVMGFFATAFCTAGILISKDYQSIAREALDFKFGHTMYILIVLANAVMWQCFYVGAIGVIFYGSSLLSSIIIHALLPTTELLAVVIYKEKFRSEKGVALFLCLWGFTSYFYGQFKEDRESKKNCSPESDQTCGQGQAQAAV